MMASVETYLRTGCRQLQQWAVKPGVQQGGKAALCTAWGFFFSAAALAGYPQPLVMGAVSSLRGWWAGIACLGALGGYPLFWGGAGLQGLTWAGFGLLLSFLPEKLRQEQPLLPAALAAFFTAAAGLFFQLGWEVPVPFSVYLLRVGAAAGATALFGCLRLRQDPFLYALAGGLGVLAVARVGPGTFLRLGYIASGMMAVATPLTGAAMAGLGLDLAGVTGVSMTAVMCLTCFLRLVPVGFRWYRYITPALAGVAVMLLSGRFQPEPLPGLMLGGALAYLLPPRPDVRYRRGETGVAQVRLELTAEVMSTLQQLLLETAEPPADEDALLRQVRVQACGSCSARGSCRDQERLKPGDLEDPGGFQCRKTGRIRSELRRGQEQLRRIRADRLRQGEYRSALIQQYQFLAIYLRRLSDQLPRRGSLSRPGYRVEVSARSRSRERANGDRCLAFPGVGCRYYVLLSDGMGTGLGAQAEGQTALNLLRQMLTAGFPGEYALRSLNSLLVLRGRAGAVTVDLAEICLDSGWVTLYKWGAAPSWLLRSGGTEKIGTTMPPPGLSVTEGRETVERLSLRRGEVLIMVSDGLDGEDVLSRLGRLDVLPPERLAAKLTEHGAREMLDDATAVVVRLNPGAMATSYHRSGANPVETQDVGKK